MKKKKFVRENVSFRQAVTAMSLLQSKRILPPLGPSYQDEDYRYDYEELREEEAWERLRDKKTGVCDGACLGELGEQG